MSVEAMVGWEGKKQWREFGSSSSVPAQREKPVEFENRYRGELEESASERAARWFRAHKPTSNVALPLIIL